MAGMPPSPRKHEEIKVVSGTPSDIVARGRAITALGDAMYDAADVLQDIKERALEDGTQKGKAIGALRDSIGDSYETLREAAGLYRPVGPVITRYGEELQSIRTRMVSSVETCDTRWSHYVSLPGDKDPNPMVPVEEGSQEAEDNQAKQAAYDAWVEAAQDWEADFNSWEEAFDDAVNDIGEEMSGEIKDGWWENWGSDLFEFLNTVLNIAGLVIGVVCLITGGFLIAALVIAIATLVVVAVRYAHDEASGLDLAFAIVGVVGAVAPFVKMAPFLQPAAGAADEAADLATVATRSTRVSDVLLRTTTGQSLDDLTRLTSTMEGLGMGAQFTHSQILVVQQLAHVSYLVEQGHNIPKFGNDVPNAIEYVTGLVD